MSQLIKFLTFSFVLLIFANSGFANQELAANTHFQKAEQYYEAQNFDKALDEYRHAVELNPGMIKGWEKMGWVNWKLQDIEETIRIWENVRIIKPNDPQLLNSLSKAYEFKGNFKEAFSANKDSLQANPNQPSVRFDLAKNLSRNRDYEGAINEFESLLEKNPDDDLVRYELSKNYRKVGQRDKAIDYLETLSKENPDKYYYRLDLASLKGESGEVMVLDEENLEQEDEQMIMSNSYDSIERLDSEDEEIPLQKPVILKSYEFFEDNNSHQNHRLKNLVDYRFSEDLLLQGEYTLSFYRGNDTGTIRGHNYRIGGTYEMPGKEIEASYQFNNYSNDDRAHNYALAYSTEDIPEFKKVRFYHGRHSVDTADAIVADIQYINFGAEVHSNLDYGVDFKGSYEIWDFNDGNIRNTFKALFAYALREDPVLTVGYESIYDNTKNETAAYFSPDHMFINQAKIRYKDRVFQSKLFLNISLALGYAQERNEPNEVVTSVDSGLTYTIKDNMDAFISYVYADSSSYDTQRVETGIRVVF